LRQITKNDVQTLVLARQVQCAQSIVQGKLTPTAADCWMPCLMINQHCKSSDSHQTHNSRSRVRLPVMTLPGYLFLRQVTIYGR